MKRPFQSAIPVTIAVLMLLVSPASRSEARPGVSDPYASMRSAQGGSVQLSPSSSERATAVSAILISAPASVSATEGGSVSIKATVGSGNPNSIITITATGFPSGLFFTTNTPTAIQPSATISGTLAVGTTGVWFIHWEAWDQFGAFDDSTTQLTVTSTNHAPVLDQPSNMTVSEGTTADQQLRATDTDGNPIGFTLASGPSFVSVATTDQGTGIAYGNVHVAPNSSESGSYTVQVRASDGVLQDTRSFSLQVVDVPLRGEPVWERVADLYDPRTGSGVEGAAASLIAGKLYVSHGYRYYDTDFLSIYDVATNTWTHGGPTAPDARVSRSEMAGGTAFGKHYAIGGRSRPNADVEEFDPATGQWSTRASMSLARGGAGAASWQNKIYVVGGRSGGSYGVGTIYSLCEVYDPAINRWTTLAPMPRAVSDNYATVAYGGKVYVFGGTDGSQNRSDVQIYNIATNQWTLGAPMPTARGAAMAGVIGNKIAVFGGYSGGSNLRVTELYDPAANVWSAGPEMPLAVSEMAQGVTYDRHGIYSVGSGMFGLAASVVLVLRPVISLDAPASVSVDEGQSLSFVVSAADRSGLPVTLSATGLPNGALFTDNGNNTGTFKWTPGFSEAGAHTVTFLAQNSEGASSEAITVIEVRNVNRPPISNPGGPYTSFQGSALSLDGTGSSDPDGDALTYLWVFGDGTNGAGPTPSHTYTTIGTYGIALTVSDGVETNVATTTVAVVGLFDARAFTTAGNRLIRLASGKPTWCAQIEPVGHAFSLSLVDVSTIVMKSSGTGSVDQISALFDKTTVLGDRDGNGVDELTVCFRKNDLGLLFSNLHGTTSVPVTIEGKLFGGGIFRASLDVGVVASGGALTAFVSPNPLNPSAVLTFFTPEAGTARVILYGASGRLTATLLEEKFLPAGYHDVPITGIDSSGRRLASGIYFYRVETASGSVAGRFAILK